MGNDAREHLVNGLADREIPTDAILLNSKLTKNYEGTHPSESITYDLSERLSGVKDAKDTHMIIAHTIYDYVVLEDSASSTVERFGPISCQRIVFKNPEFKGVLHYDASHNPDHIVIYGPFGIAGKSKGVQCASLKEGVTRMLLEFLKSQNKSTQVSQVMPNE